MSCVNAPKNNMEYILLAAGNDVNDLEVTPCFNAGFKSKDKYKFICSPLSGMKSEDFIQYSVDGGKCGWQYCHGDVEGPNAGKCMDLPLKNYLYTDRKTCKVKMANGGEKICNPECCETGLNCDCMQTISPGNGNDFWSMYWNCNDDKKCYAYHDGVTSKSACNAQCSGTKPPTYWKCDNVVGDCDESYDPPGYSTKEECKMRCKKGSAPFYRCESGGCIPSSDPRDYNTFGECEQNCTDDIGYVCNLDTGNCQPGHGGTDLETCKSQCSLPPPPGPYPDDAEDQVDGTYYACDPTSFTCAPSTNPDNFSTENECLLACQPPPSETYYSCNPDTWTCSESINDTDYPTRGSCEADCKPPSHFYKCNPDTGNCQTTNEDTGVIDKIVCEQSCVKENKLPSNLILIFGLVIGLLILLFLYSLTRKKK